MRVLKPDTAYVVSNNSNQTKRKENEICLAVPRCAPALLVRKIHTYLCIAQAQKTGNADLEWKDQSLKQLASGWPIDPPKRTSLPKWFT